MMARPDGHCTVFFSALANPMRIRILQELLESPLNVNTLSERIGMERSLLSHNLALLSKADLVQHRKSGSTRIYSANEEIVPHLFMLMSKVVCPACSLRKTCDGLRERQFRWAAGSGRQPCKGCK
ncbi:MAG: metalloregulator ArsR/SmtB family transcription factor [Candidatus Micrarchaeia archaeon]